MAKCKYCGAKGVKISHFMRKHKALMLRKMRAGRKKSHRKGSSGGSGRKKVINTTTGGFNKLTVILHN